MPGKYISVTIFLIAFILIFEYVFVASAGTLTIKTQTTVKTEGDFLKGTIKVCNRGTVAAHDVQANIVFQEKRIKTPAKELLAVNECKTYHFEEILTGIKKGRHPLTVIVDFQDAAQYPFSAISCTTFFFKEDVNVDLLCLIDELTMNKKGKLRCEIKNLGLGPMNIRSTLILPKELSSPGPHIDFDIEPRGEKTVVFEIENFSALSGASYPVFFFFEYDLRDTHYTAISRSVVRIPKKENWFRHTRWLLAAIAVILGAIFALYQLKKGKSFQKSKPQFPVL